MTVSTLATAAVIGVAALAAYLPTLRLPLAAALVSWLVVVRVRGLATPAALGASLPLAILLAWSSLPQPASGPGMDWCEHPASPPSVWRLAGAVLALVAVALVVGRSPAWRDQAAALGLRWPSRLVLAVSLGGFLLVAPIALFGGALLGNLFFGRFELDVWRPWALLPALVFAFSNAAAEELVYRGATRTWLTPMLGVIGANLAQAILFGLAHTGADFEGPMLPVVVSMVLVGVVGGVITRRTGSLALPIAVHAAADLPIYYYWACRLPG